MEHKQGTDPTAVVAERVKEVRGRRDLTAQQLADKLKAVGIPWDRATVTKLETGRRQNVTLGEVLALARVLDVAPVHLVVPLNERPYEVTPTETQPADRVRGWVRGETSLPGTNLRTFRSEVPLEELQPSPRQRIAHAYLKRLLDEAKEQGRPTMADLPPEERPTHTFTIEGVSAPEDDQQGGDDGEGS